MKEESNVEKLFVRVLILLPLLYIGLSWYIGLNYGCKSIIFGPYPDIPVVLKTGLLGCPLEYISGAKAMMMVVPVKDPMKNTNDSTYSKRSCYFEVPGSWKFDFAPSGTSSNLKKIFALTGSYSRAICHDIKNPGHSIGSLSVSDLNDFLKRTGRIADMEKLKPYLFLSRIEEKYPYVYSETVLLSNAMGNIFKDNMVPYDVLGLAGIVILFIALAARSLFLWMYYLLWVASYWFGRIGYHNPILAFSNEGWQIIFWSFWHGFIQEEGRLFLVISLGLSVMIFGILGIMQIPRQALSFLKGEYRLWKCEN